MLRELKILRKNHEDTNPFLRKLRRYCVHRVSKDNFPTAAEWAFAPASFAALVRPIPDLYEPPAWPTELSKVTRQGPRWGFRWLFGGYVAGRWDRGRMGAIRTWLKWGGHHTSRIINPLIPPHPQQTRWFVLRLACKLSYKLR